MQLLATPWTANPPSSSVHGISQARILDWVAISFFRGSSQPGIEPVSPTLAGRFFTIEPPGKPRDKIKQRCICKDVHCCDVYNSETKLDKTKTGKLSRRSKIFPSRIQGKWFLIKDFRGKRGENAYYMSLTLRAKISGSQTSEKDSLRKLTVDPVQNLW